MDVYRYSKASMASLQLAQQRPRRDRDLAEVMRIVNLLLRNGMVSNTIKDPRLNLGLSDAQLSVQFRRVKLEWGSLNNAYASTPRRKNAKTITLASIIKTRLHRAKQPEKRRLLVLAAIVTLHELAHLILRWNGRVRSPTTKVHEAGIYFESHAFGGEVRAKILTDNLENGWRSKDKCVGILIGSRYEMTDDDIDRFFQANTPVAALVPFDLKAATINQGELAYDNADESDDGGIQLRPDERSVRICALGPQ